MRKNIYPLIVTCLFAISCNNEVPSVPYLEASESSLEIWFDQREHSIAIKSSDVWNATSECEWINISTTEGDVGEQKLYFSVSQNDSDDIREGAITIQSTVSDIHKTISVKQHAKIAEYLTIHYTTIDNKSVAISNSDFSNSIISNTYQNGTGILTFNKTITSIDAEAFYGNETLKTVTLPSSVLTISDWAFSNCIYLTSINIPERVISIGNSAFAYCMRLQEIDLPNSINNIGASAFSGCSALRRFSGKYASSDNRCLILNDIIVKFAPKGIKTYNIPDGTKGIGADAFYESTSLEEVTIPASVTSIGDYAFYYCESLERVYCKATTPPTLGEAAFDNYENGAAKPIGCTFYVPKSSVELYKSKEGWDKYKNYVKEYNF